jgi:TRAP transporter TAXI family solute receptor
MVHGPGRWPGLVQLEAMHKVHFVKISDSEIKKLREAVPAYVPVSVPAGTYKAMKTDYKTVAVWNHFLVNKNMPEDIAYKLVKATYENQEEFLKVHPISSTVTIENANKAIIPLHPGTIRYLNERGVKVPSRLIMK